MRRRVLLGILALLAATHRHGQASAAAGGFALADLMRVMATVESSRAEFTETKTLALLARPLVVTGTLAYTRPARLERHVLAPTEERLAVAGGDLTIETGGGKARRTIALATQPMLWAFVESIRATLAGDQKSLERFYWVRLDGASGAWTLNLEPRDSAMSQYVQLIRLGGAGSRIERVEVFETNGDRSLMRIKPLG